MQPLSVFITTYNNARTLAACLDSVRWADEILVLDSFSTDATLDIARAYGCVIHQEPFKGYGPQKQSALGKTAHRWVLLLDADEMLSPELQQEIQAPLRPLFMAMNPESGPTHPHLVVLEIAVETGILGLIGFVVLWLWLLKAIVQAIRHDDDRGLAWLLAFALSILPFNSGHAFYGSQWSGIVFWLLIMALVVRQDTRPCECGGRP